MRRLLGIMAFMLVVCLLANDVALAQGQGGRGGRGGFGGGQSSLSFLLSSTQVQKELSLTDDQTAKIKEIRDASRPQRGAGGRTSFRDMTEEQRTALREEMRKRGEETTKKLTEILTADQNARVKQIQLWMQGPRALTDNADVGKELSLSDEQKAAVKTVLDESGKRSQELRGGRRNASADDRKKIDDQLAAMRTETETESLAQLTPDQKAKLESLKGPKFELDRSQLARGGRGRSGRPGSNNN